MTKRGVGRRRARTAVSTVAAAVVLAATGLWALPASAGGSSSSGGTPSHWGAFWASLPTDGGNAYLVSGGTTFVVPAVNCTGNTRQLGESFGVEQGGGGPFVGYEQALVTEECNQTTASYQFFVKVGSTSFTEGGVSPGDTVVASFFEASNFAQSIVHDLTSGYTWIADGSPMSLGAADIGEFDVIPSSAALHVAPFGSVTFTKCQVNGDYLGYGNNLTQWSLRLGGTHSPINISTGAISTGKDSFKLTFRHS